jgi:inner membrane protein
MVSGRLVAESTRARPAVAMAGFALLAMLPDIDVCWSVLGIPDAGLFGHRGLTHTPAFALALGASAAAVISVVGRGRWAGWRFGLVVALVVLSHGVLDALAQDGRGIMTLWPLSSARYHFLWRPIPDAPTGLAFFSRKGMVGLAIELIYFAPLLVRSFWPGAALTRRVRVLAITITTWLSNDSATPLSR